MRILFVDQFSDLGGAQLCVRDVMAECQERGWDAWFAAPGNGEMFAHCRAAGIPTQSLVVGTYESGRKSLRNIARYAFDMSRAARLISETVRRNRIDAVYVNGPRILPAASGTGRPLIFHLHSVLDKGYSRTIARWALRRGHGSAIMASQFVAKTLGAPSQVIYNGVRDFGFVVRPRTARRLKVGIVGRIAPEKGHLDFLRAARLLADRGNDTHFMVVGAPLFSDPSYEIAVRAAAADMDVEFRGWAGDVAALLHEIDILVAPCSAGECTPRILPEAFSAGTPVVAYPSGGIPELIRHGDTGILTAQAGPEALAAGIEGLLTNPDLMARLSVNGRREWETRFRLDRFRNDVAGVIERACDVQSGQAEAATAVAREDYLPRAGTPHG
jgi:glycosyltransferase involved in cell wall biosynthesis